MLKYIVHFAAVGWAFLAPALLFAEQPSPAEVAGRIQAVYDGTSSMAADFSQATSSSMSRREKLGGGTVLLLKPGKMRWDYTTPDQQVVICDGNSIVMYFARENQMLVSSAKQYLESDVAYSFFAGNGNLLRDFEVSYPEEEALAPNQESTILRIVPKARHPQIDYILLWTDHKYLINRLVVVDQFGSSTDITFSHIRLNGTIPEDSFSFTPPEGTEIVKQ